MKHSHRINVAPILDELGATVLLDEVVDLDGYDVGETHYNLKEPPRILATVSNVGGGELVITGSVSAVAQAECSRCLEAFDLELDGELEGSFVDVSRFDEENIDEEMLPIEDEHIDIALPVHAALVFETPFAPLCKDECKGLCAQCGQDLNKGSCSCKAEEEAQGPFAALRELNISNEDEKK